MLKQHIILVSAAHSLGCPADQCGLFASMNFKLELLHTESTPYTLTSSVLSPLWSSARNGQSVVRLFRIPP